MMHQFESKKKQRKFFWACENKEHPLRNDDGGKSGMGVGIWKTLTNTSFMGAYVPR